MNAINHSKFALSMADMIKADYDYYDAEFEADVRGEDISKFPGSPTHDLIMERSCTTLSELREKLAWMTERGTGLVGEEDAFRIMLADLDRMIAVS